MDELNNFFLGVQQVAQDAVDKAPYDRTFRGVIENVNNDGTCNVRINGRTYNNIPYKVTISQGDIVDVLFPQNNPRLMIVQGTNDLFDKIYPIGSIYMSINNTNPSVLFGGSWQQIKDTFLLSAGDNYTAGDIGGEANHTLTVDEIPSHSHRTGIYTDYSTLPPARESTVTGYRTVAYGTESTVRTGSTGGGQAHNNMPPYLTVYMWQRIG